jgi:hypothetical protein
MAEWRCRISGRQQGPLTDEQLLGLARRGTLRPTDLVWNPGARRWDSASRLRGLFPAAAAGVALPAPSASAIAPGGAPPADPGSFAASDAGPFIKISDKFLVEGGSWWRGRAVASPGAFYLLKTGMTASPYYGAGTIGRSLAYCLNKCDDVRSCTRSSLPSGLGDALDPEGRWSANDVIVLPRAAVSMVEVSALRGVRIRCGGDSFALFVPTLAAGDARTVLAELGWTLGAAVAATARPLHGSGYGRAPGETNPLAPPAWLPLVYLILGAVAVLLVVFVRAREAFTP